MALRRIDHVLVLTDDLEATKEFYCEALGLEVGKRPTLEFPGYWLYLEGVPCVHVAERGPYEAHAAALGLQVGAEPIDHVSFAGADYERVAARLEAAGVQAVTNTVAGTGWRQLFITDPNGVRIEVNLPG